MRATNKITNLKWTEMPTREKSSEEQAEKRTPRREVEKTPTRKKAQNSDEDDTWDEIMTMKNKSDESNVGFNKMNTNFYLKDGEEVEVIILDESPVIFWAHVIKCETEKGQTFYRTEQCQKSEQDHCVLCESNNPAISGLKKIIAFRILDARGMWDKKVNGGKGGFDNVAAPKIFLLPLYLAKQLKSLKDDCGSGITNKIIKLSKNSTYMASFKYNKSSDGSLRYAIAPEYDGVLPDILEVYAPQSDNELIDFIQKFTVADVKATSKNYGSKGSGGSFGN